MEPKIDENMESKGERSKGTAMRMPGMQKDLDPTKLAQTRVKTATSNKPNTAGKGRSHPLAMGGEILACGDMTPDPATAGNLTVQRPARTYERKRTFKPPPNPCIGNSVKAVLDSSSEHFTLNSNYDMEQNPELDAPDPREDILNNQNGFSPSEHPERSGSTGLILHAPRPQLQSWSPDLNCQLARLQLAAETGNAFALLLLEQITAYGKPRHHFSKRLLVTCARWRKRYCLAYSHARKTQLFTLPSATTLNKRCLPRPISTMGPNSTANVLFDIRPYRYKSGQRFQTKLSMW